MRIWVWRSVLVFLAVLVVAPATMAAPPVEAYGKLPALDLVRLSPSGDKIAYIANEGDTRRLFVRKVNGDALLIIGVGTEKVRGMEWAGDDYVLVSISATFKSGNGLLDKWSYSTRSELSEVIILNIENKTILRVFKDQAQAIWPVGDPFNAEIVNGKWTTFVDGWSVNGGRSIYRVDMESGKYSAMSGYGLGGYASFIDTHGVITARSQYNEETREWRLLVGDHGNDVVVSRKSSLDTSEIAGAGRSGGSILVSEDATPNDLVDEFPIRAGATPTPLFEGMHVESYLRDPLSHRLIGATLADDPGVMFFDAKLQRRSDAARKAFAGLRVTLASYSADMSKFVVMTDGGDDPGTYWLVDMTTGKATDLMAAYPDIEPKDVGPTSLFAYHAGDGLALDGVLTLPPGKTVRGLPLVVIPHGGPIGVRDKVGFDFWAQAFASRGYAVFQPNYRGSGGRGAVFRHAGFGQWGGKMLTDISDGVDALAKAGVIDRTRTCIVGASYGGYAALAGVTIQHGLYRCAVSVSGVSDVGAAMLDQGDSSSYAGGRYSQTLFGVPYAADVALRKISPLWHASEADAPIMMIHGKDDTVVPFVNSASMQTALIKAGKTVEFVPLDSEDHWWSHEKTRVQILQASVAFVQKYNPAS